MLILHYTGMQSTEQALARLCDPAAEVSAHYLIDEAGSVFALVDEAMRAWHAGVGSWADDPNINDVSIGIELSNPGHEFGYRAFAEPQMTALIALCHDIAKRHDIPVRRILGHSDVAPTRKQDPGELFDWQRLAEEGLGVWPEIDNTPPTEIIDEAAARALLSRIGYDRQAPLDAVITAFQRHFRPTGVDGVLDPETVRLIQGLAAIGA